MSYILEALKKSEQERKLGDSPDISSDHQLLQPRRDDRSIPMLILILLIIICLFCLAYFVAIPLVEKKNKNTISLSQKQKDQYHSIYQSVADTYKNSDDHSHGYDDSSNGYDTSAKVGSASDNNNISTTNSSTKNTTDQSEGNIDSLTTLLSESSKELANDIPNVSSEEGFEIIRPNKERRAAILKQIENEALANQELISDYQAWFDQDNEYVNERARSRLENSSDISKENSTANNSTNSKQNSNQQEVNNTLSTQNENKNDDWESYQDIASLNSNLKQQLPSIKVSTHIYSSAANFRKVTINGINLKQGQQVGNDLYLELITEEGVIFSFKGERFRMKALEAWDG